MDEGKKKHEDRPATLLTRCLSEGFKEGIKIQVREKIGKKIGLPAFISNFTLSLL